MMAHPDSTSGIFIVLSARFLGLLIERPDKKFTQGFTGELEEGKTSNRFSCSFLEGGRAGSLCGVRVGLGPGVCPPPG